MTRRQCDLLIVGAGPAGMSAAAAACAAGLSVIIADEAPSPGGQIYRNVAHAPASIARWLGGDYVAGRTLVDALLDSGAQYVPYSVVWQVTFEPAPVAMLTQSGPSGGTLEIGARAVLIATGAQERPWPVRGWTLPGVMGVGAAQTLLKSASLAPSADTVLVGSGPLLWLFAAQLSNADRRIRALVDTTPRDAWRRALPHALPALRGADYLLKGWRMLRTVRRAGIPVYRRATDVCIEGDGRAQRIRFRDEHGIARTFETSLALLHQGVIPSTQLARALGCKHEWDPQAACWHPQCDARGRSSVPQVWIAGDGAGIGGARAAALAGEVSALDIAAALGALDTRVQKERERPLMRALRRHLAVRPLLDALYTPHAALRRPDDGTIVCRCEEVTAGEIRELAALGCQGPNQMKAFTRCGMGSCQGRWCGTTVSELIAQVQQRDVGEVGHYRIRAPIKPITVGEMADALELSNDFRRGEFPS